MKEQTLRTAGASSHRRLPFRELALKPNLHRPVALTGIAGRLHGLLTLFVSLSALVAAPAALAQTEPEATLQTVVITANRSPVLSSKVGSSVEVLTEEDLKNEPSPFLKDALESLPGINFSQFGPPGTQANLTLRGAAANYVVVRIDGMEMSDNSSATPYTKFEHLLSADVSRIEVLKGSQSALYGGQAIGGVIEITTRRPPPNSFGSNIAATAGSYGTREGAYTLQAADERSYLSVTLANYDSDGFSAFNKARGGVEPDGYRNFSFSTKAGIDLDSGFSLSATLRGNNYRLEYDEPGRDNLTNYYTGRDIGARINGEWQSADLKQRHSLSIERFEAHRDYPAFKGQYDGTRSKLEYLGKTELSSSLGLTWGADWREDGIRLNPGAGNAKADTRLWGVFGEVAWAPLQTLNLTAAVRQDRHSVFGNKVTQRATAAWQALPQTRLRASYGTGFLPPSLFQLYSLQYGNTSLQPETSRSVDLGVEQAFLQGQLKLGLTRFRLDTENLIDFNRSTNKYYQLGGETRRKGWELATAWAINSATMINANYTRIDTATATGQRLQRVPRHDASLALKLAPRSDLTLVLRANRVIDIPEPAAPGRRLPPYTVIKLSATWAVTPTVELVGRIENLFDEEYETTYRYGTAGRSFYLGVRARF
jgi:vitamin B12 transporter